MVEEAVFRDGSVMAVASGFCRWLHPDRPEHGASQVGQAHLASQLYVSPLSHVLQLVWAKLEAVLSLYHRYTMSSSC